MMAIQIKLVDQDGDQNKSSLCYNFVQEHLCLAQVFGTNQKSLQRDFMPGLLGKADLTQLQLGFQNTLP